VVGVAVIKADVLWLDVVPADSRGRIHRRKGVLGGFLGLHRWSADIVGWGVDVGARLRAVTHGLLVTAAKEQQAL
jgi:hypothetical protein